MTVSKASTPSLRSHIVVLGALSFRAISHLTSGYLVNNKIIVQSFYKGGKKSILGSTAYELIKSVPSCLLKF